MGDNVIDDVAAEVRRMHRAAGVSLLLDIGRLVVDRFFGGSIDGWRARGERDASLRALARRFDDDDDVTPLLVHRALHVFDVELRLGVLARGALSASHLRAVAGLPVAKQDRLLTDAERHGWSSRELERNATTERRRADEKRGRKPLPAYQKSINAMSRALADGLVDLDGVRGLPAERRATLRQQVDALRAALDAVVVVLDG